MRLTLDLRFFLAVLGVIFLVWLLNAAGAVVLPFLIAALLAVILEPTTKWMCQRGVPRWAAALISTLLALIVIFAPLVSITPILVIEGGELFNRLPTLIDNVAAIAGRMLEGTGIVLPEFSAQSLAAEGGPLRSLGVQAAGSIGSVLSGALLVLLTPVALFFFLKDWPEVTKTLSELPPRPYAKEVRHIAKDTNLQLARWVRGQSLVILSQMIYHAAGLFLLGLNYSIAIGVLTGLSSIIPVIGNLIFFVLALLVAINQFDSIWPILGVVAIFGSSQVIETVFLAPRLVGDQLKLHPLWIMAGLLIGGSLFGFLGALLALPATAAISVFAKHGLRHYKQSSLYRGDNQKSDKGKTA